MTIVKTPCTIELADRFLIESKSGSGAYEISVALPLSYHDTEKDYPVLVILDAHLAFATAVDTARTQAVVNETSEIIVVGIAVPRKEGLDALATRRVSDFTPLGVRQLREFNHVYMKHFLDHYAPAESNPENALGRASDFLKFVESELFPVLSDNYRINEKDVGLFGRSVAGVFAGYALMEGCRLFSKYIFGSFATVWFGKSLEEMEQTFKSRKNGHAVGIYMGVAQEDVSNLITGSEIQAGIDLIKRLEIGSRGNLNLFIKIYEQGTHASIIPSLLAAGISRLYAASFQPD